MFQHQQSQQIVKVVTASPQTTNIMNAVQHVPISQAQQMPQVNIFESICLLIEPFPQRMVVQMYKKLKNKIHYPCKTFDLNYFSFILFFFHFNFV